eukprot:5638672-Amphidinium_carterae.1
MDLRSIIRRTASLSTAVPRRSLSKTHVTNILAASDQYHHLHPKKHCPTHHQAGRHQPALRLKASEAHCVGTVAAVIVSAVHIREKKCILHGASCDVNISLE